MTILNILIFKKAIFNFCNKKCQYFLPHVFRMLSAPAGTSNLVPDSPSDEGPNGETNYLMAFYTKNRVSSRPARQNGLA
jgi:hypothetical protein